MEDDVQRIGERCGCLVWSDGVATRRQRRVARRRGLGASLGGPTARVWRCGPSGPV